MKFSPPAFSLFYTLFTALFFTSASALAVIQNTESSSGDLQKSQSFQLLMAGGGLRICSELDIQHCNDKQIALYSETRNSKTYLLSEKSFSAVLQTPGFQALPHLTQNQLTQIFQHFYANPLDVNSPEEIRLAFAATTEEFDAASLFSNLPNDVYYAILDFTQQAAPFQIGVNVVHSKSLDTRSIIGAFVTQAASRRDSNTPLQLTFITAGFRDPFEYVEYYRQVFQQAATLANFTGFSVNWLPLDQSLMQALRDRARGLNSCDNLDAYRSKNQLFNAKIKYPELTSIQRKVCEAPENIEKLLANSHGLFIAAGDAMRILSLFRNPQFKATTWQGIISQKVQNGSLFLAGSDTGAAVIAGGVFENRPIPFITGGTSQVALFRGAFAMSPAPFGCEKDQNCPFGMLEEDLTFESRGGIGGFNLGTIDTRFSELDREARIAVLTAVTRTRFGFGIDENTALLFTDAPDGDKTMKVIGENGVFIADMRDAIVKTQSGKHQIIGMSHYFNDSDQIVYSASDKELSFRFASSSAKRNNKTMVLPLGQGEFRRNVAINCGTASFHRWTENNIAWLINPTEDTEFYINPTGEMEKCSYSNLLFGIEN